MMIQCQVSTEEIECVEGIECDEGVECDEEKGKESNDLLRDAWKKALDKKVSASMKKLRTKNKLNRQKIRRMRKKIESLEGLTRSLKNKK